MLIGADENLPTNFRAARRPAPMSPWSHLPFAYGVRYECAHGSCVCFSSRIANWPGLQLRHRNGLVVATIRPQHGSPGPIVARANSRPRGYPTTRRLVSSKSPSRLRPDACCSPLSAVARFIATLSPNESWRGGALALGSTFRERPHHLVGWPVLLVGNGEPCMLRLVAQPESISSGLFITDSQSKINTMAMIREKSLCA